MELAIGQRIENRFLKKKKQIKTTNPAVMGTSTLNEFLMLNKIILS